MHLFPFRHRADSLNSKTVTGKIRMAVSSKSKLNSAIRISELKPASDLPFDSVIKLAFNNVVCNSPGHLKILEG
jgi:hypothetical protein